VSAFIKLSHFYRSFAELYSAGIEVPAAMQTLSERENSRSSVAFGLVVSNLRKGRSLFQSLKVAQLVPVNDLPLVKAAEDSGRVVDVFKSLSQKHADTDASFKKLRMSLVKPYFIFAVALMFPGVIDLFNHQITLFVYLRNSLGILLLVTLFFYFIYDYWVQSFFNTAKARTLYQILKTIPFFGSLSDRIAMEKFSNTMAFMLDSSIDFFETLKQAGQCSSNPMIQKAIERIIPKIQNGADVKIAFQSEPVFPTDFVTAISLGSQSGKLPEFLTRYSTNLKNQNEATIQGLVRFIPVLIYWGVIGQVVYVIVNFYSSYLDQALKIAP
jgi:type IV pilus assembly protein PilC